MPSKSRRQAREAALRALYQVEIGGSQFGGAIEDMLEHSDLSEELAGFAEQLVRGIAANLEELDGKLTPLLKEWDFMRIAPIDRGLLRIAAYELFHMPSVPPAVTINEAVEMAKKYSTAESGRFVNGVLGRLLTESPKASWNPSSAPDDEPMEAMERTEDPPVETILEGTPEAEELSRIGLWKVRSGDRPA